MVKKVIISAGREVGGLDAFARALAHGFGELGIEAEILPLKEILSKRRNELRDANVLKIFSTTAVFIAPFCKNVISVAHGLPRMDAQGFWRFAVILLSYRLASKYGILGCVSNYSKRNLKAFFNIQADGTIFNAVLPMFLDTDNKKIQRSYITYIGRLHSVKNVIAFLEPLKKISKLYPEFTIQIIGHGSDERAIRELTKDNDRFFVLPPKEPNEVAEILRKSEIFFSGCETEGLGISYIEALTQGAKVVMPNSGGGLEIAPKLIGKKIFTFDLSMDEDSIFGALEAAILSNSKDVFDITPFIPEKVATEYLKLSEIKKYQA